MKTHGIRPAVIGLLLIGAALAAPVWSAPAPEPVGAAADYTRLRITTRRPPCSDLPAMPVVPNDPAALTVPGRSPEDRRRCLGTRPPELEVLLPADGYAWLAQEPAMPPVWLDLGTVIVNPRDYETPPLGFRLSGQAPDYTLELRSGDLATLTPLPAETWTEVVTPDGASLWVHASR